MEQNTIGAETITQLEPNTIFASDWHVFFDESPILFLCAWPALHYTFFYEQNTQTHILLVTFGQHSTSPAMLFLGVSWSGNVLITPWTSQDTVGFQVMLHQCPANLEFLSYFHQFPRNFLRFFGVFTNFHQFLRRVDWIFLHHFVSQAFRGCGVIIRLISLTFPSVLRSFHYIWSFIHQFPSKIRWCLFFSPSTRSPLLSNYFDTSFV